MWLQSEPPIVAWLLTVDPLPKGHHSPHPSLDGTWDYGAYGLMSITHTHTQQTPPIRLHHERHKSFSFASKFFSDHWPNSISSHFSVKFKILKLSWGNRRNHPPHCAHSANSVIDAQTYLSFQSGVWGREPQGCGNSWYPLNYKRKVKRKRKWSNTDLQFWWNRQNEWFCP